MTKLILSIIFYFMVENCLALEGNGGYVTASNTITPTARSAAMGSVGYALGDDETCLMFNPAGLGFTNFHWIGGAISYTLANQFLPSENLYTIAYQNENFPRLGFSACLDQTKQSIERTIIGPDYEIYPDGELTPALHKNVMELREESSSFCQRFEMGSKKLLDFLICADG